MMYLSKLINYFQLFFLSWLNVFWVFLGIILIYSIVQIIKYKKGTDYKIYNFYINSFYIFVYITVFILLLFYMRYLAWGNLVDLYVIFKKFKDLYMCSFSYFIIYLLFLIFIFISIFKIKYLLTQEIIKRHLYLFYKSQYIAKVNTKYTYEKFIKGFSKFFSYEELVYTPIRTVAASFHRKSKAYTGKFSLGFTKILEIIIYDKQILKLFVKLFPFQILIYLFIYDCYMNNFVISKIFYYLPFYLLYILWYNASEFFRKTDSLLNRIVYERYYEGENYLYVNTTEEEDNYIFAYIRNRFQTLLTPETGDGLMQFQLSIIRNRRYTRDREVSNELIYINSTTDDRVNLADLTETDLEEKVEGNFISKLQGKLMVIIIMLNSYLIYKSGEYTIYISGKLLPDMISFIIILIFLSFVILTLTICIVKNFRGNKLIFFFIGFIMLGIVGFILIKTHMFLFKNELILDYGIKIIRKISVEEKIEFISEYFKFLIQNSHMYVEKQAYLISVFNSIDLETISKLCNFEDVSIIILKEYTLNLLYLVNEQYTSYYLLLDLLNKKEILSKIDSWNTYVITLIILKNLILISKCIVNIGITESMPIIVEGFKNLILEVKEIPIIKVISYFGNMFYENKGTIKDIIVYK